jgi:transmembrane sensor
MKRELLDKYCRNGCTQEELQSVLAWFRESAWTSEGKDLLLEIWKESGDDEVGHETNFDSLLSGIHHEINLAQSKKLIQISSQDVIKHKKRERLINIFMRAAAILLLPVLCFGLYFSLKYQSVKTNHVFVSQAYNEVYSSPDAITKIVLPDGSNVWLNHSSSLKYPASFQGDTRQVELNGEGYFEVAHNPRNPFIVQAGRFRIKAVGTAFNVMAYPDEDKVETSLINGKVELQMLDLKGNVVPMGKMNPDEFTVYNKMNNEVTTLIIGDDRNFSWKSGKLVFNNEPIGEVAKKLSRWFNVDIRVKDPELLKLTYTATFVNETLPQVMELIAMVSPVNYSISDRKEISPGVFSKREVTLSKRKK